MKPLIRRTFAHLSSSLLLASLAACSILPRPEAVTVYRLPPAASPAVSQPATWSLQIASPQAQASLNRDAITVLPGNDRINNYRGARWSDPAPVLFRDALIRQLQQRYPNALISSDDSEIPTRYRLAGRLDAFQSEYRHGQPTIHIHYDAQLLRSNDSQVIAVHSFDIRLAPASADIPAVVQAFGQAVQQLDAQLQPWLESALTTAAAAPPRP